MRTADPTTIRLPADTLRAVDDLATLQGETRSAVLCRLVEAALPEARAKALAASKETTR